MTYIILEKVLRIGGCFILGILLGSWIRNHL